jgi:8-oxo-dGTP diphosphatase
VDIIVLSKIEEKIFILLIERKHPPFENYWALPGGFIEMDETLEQSALRELHEETGLQLKKLKQFAAYGDPGRDPRGRTVSIIYYAFIEKQINPIAGDDASKAKWIKIEELPALAFDHKKIIEDFLQF